MATLKQGSARTSQALEWQKRLEDLRLRDLRSRRHAEQWSREAERLFRFRMSQFG